MNPDTRRRALAQALRDTRWLWHPQPFRELRPGWCDKAPALTQALLALDEAGWTALHADHALALNWLAGYLPELTGLAGLCAVDLLPRTANGPLPVGWNAYVPGRKEAQIAAFAESAVAGALPVIDWCGGKGHLGRLLAAAWQVPVLTLEREEALCADGSALASRLGLPQDFLPADALDVDAACLRGRHAVALHACGELHRSLIRRAGETGVRRLDVAPCCYHLGLGEAYQGYVTSDSLSLSHDEVRLAVTETVTASPRLARQHVREMAWKLGFDHFRRQRDPAAPYRSFKPVPAPWMRGGFADFLAAMAARSGLAAPTAGEVAAAEAAGWQRHVEVMRLSVPRQAFRRLIELWLVLDQAARLADQGYEVSVGVFCERRLTPRNLMLSARRPG